MRKLPLKFVVIVVVVCLAFAIAPVLAVKSAEQSVGDTLTRGGKFTVNIAGIPNSSYYIWLPHTSSMTGERYDQPPFIADNQANVAEDPDGGPWTIGSYQYSNGGGQTIRDDVAPSTADMPNTRYYALVTTDSRGLATVEFDTSVYTGLRSYSVKVENPRSVDSDTLLIDLQVYTRRAPAVVEIFTTPQTISTTSVPVTTAIPVTTLPDATAVSTVPPATTSVTPAAEPVQTSMPLPATTPRSSPGVLSGIIAVGMVLLIMRRY